MRIGGRAGGRDANGWAKPAYLMPDGDACGRGGIAEMVWRGVDS